MRYLNYIKTMGTVSGDTDLIFELMAFRYHNTKNGFFVSLSEDNIWGASTFEDSLAEFFEWYGLDTYQEETINNYFDKNNKEEAIIRFNYVESIPSHNEGYIRNKKEVILKFRRFIDEIYVDLRDASVGGELVAC